MEHNKERIYKLKKLTYPKWRWVLFLLKEKIKSAIGKLSESKTYHGKWYEFTTGWSGFAIAYQEAGYDSKPHIQIYFIWGKLFIYTSRKRKPYDKNDSLREERSWGISISRESESLYIKKGKGYKFIYFPWAKDWHRTSLLLKDNTWAHETKGNRQDFYDDKIWGDKKFKEVHPYTYRLKSGKIQNVDATIIVEEREWRMKFLKWTKLFNYTRRCIDVEFSSEIGERSGSWKGGTVGCSYEILPNETPYETLKRMERNRKF